MSTDDTTNTSNHNQGGQASAVDTVDHDVKQADRPVDDDMSDPAPTEGKEEKASAEEKASTEGKEEKVEAKKKPSASPLARGYLPLLDFLDKLSRHLGAENPGLSGLLALARDLKKPDDHTRRALVIAATVVLVNPKCALASTFATYLKRRPRPDEVQEKGKFTMPAALWPLLLAPPTIAIDAATNSTSDFTSDAASDTATSAATNSTIDAVSKALQWEDADSHKVTALGPAKEVIPLLDQLFKALEETCKNMVKKHAKRPAPAVQQQVRAIYAAEVRGLTEQLKVMLKAYNRAGTKDKRATDVINALTEFNSALDDTLSDVVGQDVSNAVQGMSVANMDKEEKENGSDEDIMADLRNNETFLDFIRHTLSFWSSVTAYTQFIGSNKFINIQRLDEMIKQICGKLGVKENPFESRHAPKYSLSPRDRKAVMAACLLMLLLGKLNKNTIPSSRDLHLKYSVNPDDESMDMVFSLTKVPNVSLLELRVPKPAPSRIYPKKASAASAVDASAVDASASADDEQPVDQANMSDSDTESESDVAPPISLPKAAVTPPPRSDSPDIDLPPLPSPMKHKRVVPMVTGSAGSLSPVRVIHRVTGSMSPVLKGSAERAKLNASKRGIDETGTAAGADGKKVAVN